MTSAAVLLRATRARHGLSQRRLAIRAGTSQAWISRVERREVSPSVNSLARLLLVMGERLERSTERMPHDDDDAKRRAAHRRLSPGERLERAWPSPAAAPSSEARRPGDVRTGVPLRDRAEG